MTEFLKPPRYVINATDKFINLADLGGFRLAPDSTTLITEYFSIDRISRSESLLYYWQNGKVIIRDDRKDLTSEDDISKAFYCITEQDMIDPDSTSGMHNFKHEYGGIDEIDVNGLSGKLADSQDASSIHGYYVEDIVLDDFRVLTFDPSTGNLVYKKLRIEDDTVYYYDSIRGKWFSTFTVKYDFGKPGIVDGVYLQRAGGSDTPDCGYLIFCDLTLICMTAIHASGGGAASSKRFELRVNGDIIPIAYLDTTNYVGIDHTFDIDLNEGDYVNIFVPSTGPYIREPQCTIVMRRRID